MVKKKVSDFLLEKYVKPKDTSLLEFKYIPETKNELIGNYIHQIYNELKNIIICNQYLIILIHGISGCGKYTLCDMLLNDLKYTIHLFDINDTYKKDKFLLTIEQIIRNNDKKTGIIIQNIDNSLTDSYFTTFIKLLKKYKCIIPIICLSSVHNIQKIYKKKSIYLIEMKHPDYESCLEFVKKVIKIENINLSLNCIKYIITQNNNHIRKILQLLQLLKWSKSKKNKFLLKDIKNIVNSTITDIYYSSSEYINECLYGKYLKFTINDLLLLPDFLIQQFILDIVYSNITINFTINDLVSIYDNMIFSNYIENCIFKHQLWSCKEYSSIITLCNIILIIQQKESYKKYTIKKNLLNNLNIVIKSHHQIQYRNSSRFNLKYYEYKYIDKYINN